jgi:hypothetical protein
MNPAREGIVAEYLDMMDRKCDACLALLEGISDDLLWWRPAPREWSIGQTLDHLRVFNASMLRIFGIAWTVELLWARLRRSRPYAVDIENHYARPDFPMNTGWIWAPRHTPEKPLPFSALKDRLTAIQQRIHEFYLSRDPDLLGHITLYDPVMGSMNLIQALRLGIYHDELHYDVVERLLAEHRERQAGGFVGRVADCDDSVIYQFGGRSGRHSAGTPVSQYTGLPVYQ